MEDVNKVERIRNLERDLKLANEVSVFFFLLYIIILQSNDFILLVWKGKCTIGDMVSNYQ